MSSADDAGKLVLRVVLGVLVLLHGIFKLMNGIGPIEGMLVAKGIPAFFAWAVYVGEVLAPILIVLGLYTRLAALAIVANMLVAIALVHTAQLWKLSSSGGWDLELQGMFLFGAVAVALLGAGRYSVAGTAGRYN